MGTKRAAIYARISLTKDESVSIEGQIEQAEAYAKAKGWQVVGTYTDDGVSAGHVKPADRDGWRRLLNDRGGFDVVIIRAVDRLARSNVDFWATYSVLNETGTEIASLKEGLDMTTAQGRFVAGIMAGFAEMEWERISDRVKDSRTKLVRAGRVVGGALPYGWRSVPNPDGPGFVLSHDPTRIDFVRGMAERAIRGDSIYSIVQWLNGIDAPRPIGSQQSRKSAGWSYTTVERLLRNPVLAGMSTFNPGNRTKARGDDVLRDSDGLPVVDESVAIMTPAKWRALVRNLDNRNSPQTRPRALKAKTSALLSGLVRCDHCMDENGEPLRMWRNNIQGRPGYYCKNCRQTISNFEGFVVREFLWAKGEHVRWSVVEKVHEGGAAILPEIEHRLSELMARLQATDDDSEADRLTGEIAGMRHMRREARATAPTVQYVPTRGVREFGEDWAAAESVAEKRAILDDALTAIYVSRGRAGRGLDKSRLLFEWKMPEQVGPIPTPTDKELSEWADA